MQSVQPALKRPSSECSDASAKKPKLACTGDFRVTEHGRRHLLPSENLSELVAFFELFDLGAVLLANRQLSVLAANALHRIAVANLHFLVVQTVKHRPDIGVYATDKVSDNEAEVLRLPKELMPLALENCVIGGVMIFCEDCKETPTSPNCLWRSFRLASAKTAITRAVRLQASCFATTNDLIDNVSQFRKLSKVYLDVDETFDRDALKELARQNAAFKIEFLMAEKKK